MALSSSRSAAVSMRIGMPLPEATMRWAISSPVGPGMSRSRTAMSYALTLSSSRAASPSPAMSAAIASSRRPSRIASAIRGSSSTSSTRTLRCYEPAHIARVWKTAYVPATPRCLQCRHARRRPAHRPRGASRLSALSGRPPRPPRIPRPRRRPRRSPRHRRWSDPADTSVFDAEIPGVVKLDADLLAALRRAATDAAARVRFTVDSGWRSPAYQEQLLQQAVSKYGSEAEAARWVATPRRPRT